MKLKELKPLTFDQYLDHGLSPTSYLFKPALAAMADIARLGIAKYGHKAISFGVMRNDHLERNERTTSEAIVNHSVSHQNEYLEGVVHDVFGTRMHQLAAAAFNPAMIEMYFLLQENGGNTI